MGSVEGKIRKKSKFESEGGGGMGWGKSVGGKLKAWEEREERVTCAWGVKGYAIKGPL